MDLIEKNMVQCKVCGQLKVRILDGKYNNGKNKRWKDENDSLWNGKCCGDCHKNEMKNRQKVKRVKVV